MIKLSASSINDYLKCSKMFEFRYYSGEEGFTTEEQAIGSFVHKVIENNIDFKIDDPMVASLMVEYNIQDTDKALLYLGNFIEMRPLLTVRDTDKTEFYFREKINKELQISGKMDRVNTEDNVVYDWKASTSKKKYLSNDVQLIIYYQMYKRIFGKQPSVFIVNIPNKELRPFFPVKKYIDALFDDIIPKIVREVKAKQFYKTGYFTSSCFKCPYLSLCSVEDQ